MHRIRTPRLLKLKELGGYCASQKTKIAKESQRQSHHEYIAADSCKKIAIHFLQMLVHVNFESSNMGTKPIFDKCHRIRKNMQYVGLHSL